MQELAQEQTREPRRLLNAQKETKHEQAAAHSRRTARLADARPDLKPELTDRLNSDQPGDHAEQRGEQANIRQNTTAKRSHMNG